jgi:Carboxypeptidase regulatory-like domain
MKNKQTETNFKSALCATHHSLTLLILGSALLGLVLMSGSAWAATSAIEGTVKDPNGQPVKGADIRIEAKDGSKLLKTVKTDASGHYTSDSIPAGTYRVTVIVNGAVKASINNTKTKASEPTKLSFDLKSTPASQAAVPAKKPKHYVWVPPTTGSHLGGRWVEVNDDGTADTTGANKVKKVSGDGLRQFERDTQATGAVAVPGRP